MPFFLSRLRPVQAAWQISPSASSLRLLASESESDGPVEVSFNAYFGLLERKFPLDSTVGFESVAELSLPYGTGQSVPLSDDGSLQRVRVSFVRAQGVRLLAGFSDGEVLNPRAFDFSAVPFRDLTVQNVRMRRAAFWSQWVATGLCPDPRMYEVEGSRWLEELGLPPAECRHYVLCGHDAYAEVAAKDWNWTAMRDANQGGNRGGQSAGGREF